MSAGWDIRPTLTGTTAEDFLARLFNNCWQACSTAAGTIVKQSLARLFNSN